MTRILAIALFCVFSLQSAQALDIRQLDNSSNTKILDDLKVINSVLYYWALERSNTSSSYDSTTMYQLDFNANKPTELSEFTGRIQNLYSNNGDLYVIREVGLDSNLAVDSDTISHLTYFGNSSKTTVASFTNGSTIDRVSFNGDDIYVLASRDSDNGDSTLPVSELVKTNKTGNSNVTIINFNDNVYINDFDILGNSVVVAAQDLSANVEDDVPGEIKYPSKLFLYDETGLNLLTEVISSSERKVIKGMAENDKNLIAAVFNCNSNGSCESSVESYTNITGNVRIETVIPEVEGFNTGLLKAGANKAYFSRVKRGVGKNASKDRVVVSEVNMAKDELTFTNLYSNTYSKDVDVSVFDFQLVPNGARYLVLERIFDVVVDNSLADSVDSNGDVVTVNGEVVGGYALVTNDMFYINNAGKSKLIEKDFQSAIFATNKRFAFTVDANGIFSLKNNTKSSRLLYLPNTTNERIDYEKVRYAQKNTNSGLQRKFYFIACTDPVQIGDPGSPYTCPNRTTDFSRNIYQVNL